MLIVIDGPDGAGKTTQVANIAALLRRDYGGDRVLAIRMPGATPMGVKIREIVKGNYNVDPEAERLLFAADAMQTLSKVVCPALEDGQLVLSDRWTGVTDIAYGWAGGLDMHFIKKVQRLLPEVKPDLYIVLSSTTDETTALMERTAKRNAEVCAIEARGEAFRRNVLKQYNDFTSETWVHIRRNTHTSVFVNCMRSVEEVTHEMYNVIKTQLALKTAKA